MHDNVKARGIYVYWGGVTNEDGTKKMLYGDPLAMQRQFALELKGQNLPELLKQIERMGAEDNPENMGKALDTQDIIIAAMVNVFHVQLLDYNTGEGLKYEELMALASDWGEFVKKSKPSGVTEPNSTPSTDFPPPKSSPQNANLDYGAIRSGRKPSKA
jgi:hypothetical protein